MLNETSRHSLFLRFQAVCLFLFIPFNPGLREVFAVFLMCEVIFFMMNGGTKKIRVTFWELLLFMYYAGWLIYNYHFDGVLRMIQLTILMLTFYINRYMTSCSRKDYIFVNNIAMMAITVFLLQWALHGFVVQDSIFASGQGGFNPNSVGEIISNSVVMLNITYRIFKSDHDKKFYVSLLGFAQIFGMTILILSRCRSAIFGVFVYFLVLLCFRIFNAGKHPKLYDYAILSAFAFAILVTLVYTSLVGTELGNMLNVLSLRYTGKNFFSGRQEIWRLLLEAIARQPLLGYGLHTQPSSIVNLTLSSHNIYIQTMIQCGIIGLALLSIFMWRIVRDLKASAFASEGVAYVCSLIFSQTFTESITQTGFVYGCVAWMMLGIMTRQRKCILEHKNNTSINNICSST